MAFIFSGWNISKWAGISSIKKNTLVVTDLYKSVLKAPVDDAEELTEWDLLMKRSNMTPEKLEKKIKISTLLYRFYGSAGLALFIYSFYLFTKFPFLSGMCSLVFSGLMFAYAFREHIFVFNCKHKKVKSSLSEWCLGFFKKR